MKTRKAMTIRIDADTNDGRVVDTGYIISQSKTHALVHANKLRADIRVRLDEIHEELEGFNVTDKPQHTPTPWRIREVKYGTSRTGVIEQMLGGNLYIGEIADNQTGPDVAIANAAFIVRAVNAHEELVRELKRCRLLLAGHQDMDKVDEALAKAEGGAR